jgi:hypothetical protein
MSKRKQAKRSLLSEFSRSALRRGTFGGQRGFLALPIALSALRAVRRATSKQQETVAIERLKPGQSLTLVTGRPLSRRAGKAARR